ncbi:hypothetical protein BDZ94DRAFT_83224 [Collybia nuda]|uniref:BTB domain-containing protein n=1 Tax=Collybia nuda TaxID=64659 RepID=A0A9P5XZL2_9AGAR|nr:hypothetical protein BDZ94DRAFT_83224 [Collybia nuda]
MNPTTPTLRVSGQFSAQDADLIFQSSDGIAFRIYSKDLHFTSAGLPPFEKEKRDGILLLTEKATTLELLFSFMNPQHHPNLASTPITDLARLADAAEKYNVFPAVSICNIHMRNNLTLSQHNIPFILEYAVKHHYHDLADKAARLLLNSYSPGELLANAPVDILVAWMKYTDHWNTARARIADLIKSDCLTWSIHGRRGKYGSCVSCPGSLDPLFFPALVDLAQSTTAVNDLGAFLKKPQCIHEEAVIDEVTSKATAMAREIPNFSTLFPHNTNFA